MIRNQAKAMSLKKLLVSDVFADLCISKIKDKLRQNPVSSYVSSEKKEYILTLKRHVQKEMPDIHEKEYRTFLCLIFYDIIRTYCN